LVGKDDHSGRHTKEHSPPESSTCQRESWDPGIAVPRTRRGLAGGNKISMRAVCGGGETSLRGTWPIEITSHGGRGKEPGKGAATGDREGGGGMRGRNRFSFWKGLLRLASFSASNSSPGPQKPKTRKHPVSGRSMPDACGEREGVGRRHEKDVPGR